MTQQHLLVTGGAGFIASHLIDRLLAEGHRVTALDNFDPFYPRSIKENNIGTHLDNPSFRFLETDICDLDFLLENLSDHYDAIVHLAAKAGVRPSIQAPADYQRVNVGGTQSLLEFAKKRGIQRFIFCSSSSVYGVNPNTPWSERDNVLLPISPYAATKIAGELLGHVYSHLYGMRFIALRLFTVYGPRQRPDLAIAKFARLLLADQPIPFYGDGSTRRDYTFVYDIVDGLLAALRYEGSLYEIINLGNHHTVSLSELVAVMEKTFGKKAILERLPAQEGDVPQTFADIEKAHRLLGYAPKYNMERGVRAYAEWLQK